MVLTQLAHGDPGILLRSQRKSQSGALQSRGSVQVKTRFSLLDTGESWRVFRYSQNDTG